MENGRPAWGQLCLSGSLPEVSSAGGFPGKNWVWPLLSLSPLVLVHTPSPLSWFFSFIFFFSPSPYSFPFILILLLHLLPFLRHPVTWFASSSLFLASLSNCSSLFIHWSTFWKSLQEIIICHLIPFLSPEPISSPPPSLTWDESAAPALQTPFWSKSQK